MPAAPGTVLDGCAHSNVGQLGRHWKTPIATHAGPVWVLPETVAGGSRIGRPDPNALRLYVAIIVLSGLPPGSSAVLRVAAPSAGDLRLLYGSGDSLNPHFRYTMRAGESGVTFVSCARSQQTFPAPYTDYLGAYLVRGKRCVPATVDVPGRTHPLGLRLGACRTH